LKYHNCFLSLKKTKYLFNQSLVAEGPLFDSSPSNLFESPGSNPSIFFWPLRSQQKMAKTQQMEVLNLEFVERTYILIGNTGSGKTTLCNTLSDKSMNLKLTALPDTTQIEVHSRLLKKANELYKLDLVDTIGYSDLKYDNNSLNNYIREYIHQNYNKIHGFIFLIPKLRINKEIINTILFTINYFNLSYDDIILVFNKSTDNIFDENYIKELQKIDLLRDIINVCLKNKKVLFIDCITKSEETKSSLLDLLLNNEYTIEVPQFLEKFQAINNENILLKIRSLKISFSIFEYLALLLIIILAFLISDETVLHMSIVFIVFVTAFVYKFFRLYRPSSASRNTIL